MSCFIRTRTTLGPAIGHTPASAISPAHPPARANSTVRQLACVFMLVEIFRERAASAHYCRKASAPDERYTILVNARKRWA